MRKDSEDIKNSREKYILWMLIIIAVVIRLLSLNNMLHGDDSIVAGFAENKEYLGGTINVHPPLATIFLIATTTIFGINNWSLKLPTFIFAIATIFLVYYFCKAEYDVKTGLWASFFLTFLAWHVYGSATNIGGEGLLAFFLVLASYTFLKYTKENTWKGNLITGVFFCLAFFIKETAVLLLGVFVLYLILNKFPLRTTGVKLVIIVLVLSLGIVTLVLIDYHWNDSQFVKNVARDFVKRSVERTGYTEATPIYYLFSIFKISFWMSPLFLFSIFWFFEKEKELSWKDNLITKVQDYCFIYVILFGGFFIFYINPVFDKARYLLTIAPFLSIFAGRVIAKYTFTKRQYLLLVLWTIFCMMALMKINMERNSISFDQREEIFQKIKSLSMNFDVGIVSETGSAGFVINIRTFLIAQLFALFLGACYLYWKNNMNVAQFFLLLFLGVCLAYNFVVIGELQMHITGPDYEKATEVINNFALENKLPEPIYLVKDASLMYYLKDNYTSFMNVDTIQNSHERVEEIRNKMKDNGGSVLMVDIPLMNKKGELWQLLMQCTNLFSFSDKKVIIGYIFDCSNLRQQETGN